MSNTNPNWKLVAKRYLIVLLIFCMIGGLFMFYNSKTPTIDETAITEQYQEYLDRYESLKNLSVLAIRKGNGIDIPKLSTDNVKYRIYNTDKNVFVKYWVNPKFGRDNFSFDANLILSKEYEIEKEKYSEVKELEEFKKEYIFRQYMLTLLYATATVIGLYLALCMCYGLFHLTKHLCKLFVKEKQVVVDSDANHPDTPTS